MASSKFNLRQTNFIEAWWSSQDCCAENGCDREVFFKFSICRHSACGGCLSKSLSENPSTDSIILCPGCLHKNTRAHHIVYYVTHQEFLEKHIKCNFCTMCFGQKAIYRAPCKHLLCEPCLTSLCNLKPQPCNVQGCDFIYSSDVVKTALENASDLEIWQTFRLTRKIKCQGYRCDSKAVVEIVRCGHALCISCVGNAPNVKVRGRKQDNKDYQRCYSMGCSSTYSKLPAQRLMEKIDDIFLMTASNLEIRIDTCKKCGKIKKETIRNRKCHYVHTKCITCIASEMEKSCTKMDSLGTNVENRHIICNIRGCENEAPYRCFDAMICIIKETELKPEIFLRNACIAEKCSRCKKDHQNNGFKTIIACSHALCKNCLEEIRDKNAERFYLCEGLDGRCKYHVPRSIITNILEDTKTQMQENGGSNQNKRSEFANLCETAKKEDTHHDVAGKLSPLNDSIGIVIKTKEDWLVTVPEMEKHTRKCDMCDGKSVVALLQECKHCLCEGCLITLIESSKAAENSMMSIDCPCLHCLSFVTVKMVEDFLGNKGNPHKPQSDTANTVDQNPLTLKTTEPVTQNETLTKPDASSKRKCETGEKTEKAKMPRIHKTFGLRNVGLSCYRNTILQTLAETPSFYSLLQKSTNDESPVWIKLLCNILGRIKAEDTGTHDMLESLEQFHFEFNKTNTEYRDFQQEDTLSFLNSVLNGIHALFKKTELDEKIGDSSELSDPTLLFKGVFETAYKCLNCKVKECFEGESFFSLPLPIAESRSVKGATIGSCFEGFLDEEAIDGVPCSYCESTLMTKAMAIAHFPDILVLQICKLEEATYGRDYRPFQKKIDRVQFWEDFSGLKEHNQKLTNLKQNLKHYRLFSVVEHLGSASSGHYVCYVRRQNKWWLCDDSYVMEETLKRVKKANAYLLFYEKKDSPV